MAVDPNQNLKNILSQLQEELARRQNTVSCPNCGASLRIVSESSRSSKVTRKRAQTARPKSKRKSVVRSKGTAVSKKRRSAKASELVSLAIQYAKRKHNGRIGDAYRDVKKGIAKEAKGKQREEVKVLKTKWFRDHLSQA